MTLWTVKISSLPTNWTGLFLTKTLPGKGQHQHRGLHHKHLHLVLALECACFWMFLDLISRSDDICTEGVASHLHLRACHLGIQAPCVCIFLKEARVVYLVNGTRKFLVLALELPPRLGEGRQERLERSIVGWASQVETVIRVSLTFIFGDSLLHPLAKS